MIPPLPRNSRLIERVTGIDGESFTIRPTARRFEWRGYCEVCQHLTARKIVGMAAENMGLPTTLPDKPAGYDGDHSAKWGGNRPIRRHKPRKTGGKGKGRGEGVRQATGGTDGARATGIKQTKEGIKQ